MLDKNKGKWVEKVFIFLGIIFVLVSIGIVGRTVFLLRKYNNLDFSISKIYEMLRSVGSFYGGTLAPLLTMATVMFLGANYFHNKRIKDYEHKKQLLDDKFVRWENNLHKWGEILREEYVVFYDEENRRKRMTYEDFMYRSIKTLKVFCRRSGQCDLKKLPHINLVFNIIILATGEINKIFVELEKCPSEIENREIFLNSKAELIKTFLPERMFEIATLGYILKKLNLIKSYHEFDVFERYLKEPYLNFVIEKYKLTKYKKEIISKDYGSLSHVVALVDADNVEETEPSEEKFEVPVGEG